MSTNGTNIKYVKSRNYNIQKVEIMLRYHEKCLLYKNCHTYIFPLKDCETFIELIFNNCTYNTDNLSRKIKYTLPCIPR